MSSGVLPVPFAQLDGQKPDLVWVENQMRRARLHLRLAMNPESALKAVTDMQQVSKAYRTASTLVQIRVRLSPHDPDAAAQQLFYDQADIHFDNQLQQFYAALLSTRHRTYLEQQFGPYLFQLAGRYRLMIQPEVMQDLIRERHLIQQYNQLLQDWRFECNGSQASRQTWFRTLYEPDRRLRRQAYMACADGLSSLADPLDEHFAHLLQCRNQIAEKLGFSNFAELAWQRQGHTGITRAQREILRTDVLRYIVPLTREMRHLQRRRLSLENLAWYDQRALLAEGLPQLQIPLADLPSLLAATIDQQTEQAFDLQALQDLGYFNLVLDGPDRTLNEAGVAVSHDRIVLPAGGWPYACLHSDGQSLDVMPLLRQIGFAFGSIVRATPDDLIEYQQPAPAIRHVYAETMGLLLLPHLEPVFGIAHDDFVLLQLSEALLQLPYDCLVDAFEEQIYTQPDLSIHDRCQLWQDLERTYLPDLDHEQAPFFRDGRAWQIDDHVWQQPLGRIDRSLALLTSLDVWRLARHNLPGAWRRYVNLCRMGGRESYLNLLQQADLASPFDPATIRKVAYSLCSDLSL